MSQTPIISSGNIEVSKKNKSISHFTSAHKNLALTICILLAQATAFAQQHHTVQKKAAFDSLSNYDTATNTLINSLKQFGADEEKKNIIEYNEDTIAAKQDEIIEDMR